MFACACAFVHWDGDVGRCKSVCVKTRWNDVWSMMWVWLKSRRTENSKKVVDTSENPWTGCVNIGNRIEAKAHGAHRNNR